VGLEHPTMRYKRIKIMRLFIMQIYPHHLQTKNPATGRGLISQYTNLTVHGVQSGESSVYSSIVKVSVRNGDAGRASIKDSPVFVNISTVL